MTLSCSKKAIYIIKRNNIKQNQHFYWLNCLHSSRRENGVKSHEKVYKIKDFCGTVMTSEKG